MQCKRASDTQHQKKKKKKEITQAKQFHPRQLTSAHFTKLQSWFKRGTIKSIKGKTWRIQIALSDRKRKYWNIQLWKTTLPGATFPLFKWALHKLCLWVRQKSGWCSISLAEVYARSTTHLTHAVCYVLVSINSETSYLFLLQQDGT